ncbi:MAG: hypothetical protein U0T72_06495 [Chitinophagales bacterium]
MSSRIVKTLSVKSIGTAMVLLFSFVSMAQSGTNDEVIVIKQYQSTLNDADKITVSPEIPELETTKQTYSYRLPQRDFKTGYFQPNPLKPIALSKEKIERRNQSYIKLGFGLPWMPVAQLEYNERKVKNLKFGLHYNHLSAASFTNKLQRFSNDKVGFYLSGTPGKVEVGTAFSFHNIRNHFYAFADSSTTRKNVLQQLRSFDGNVFIKNAVENNAKLNFRQDIRFNYFMETKGKSNEWLVGGTTNLERAFAKLHHAEADFDFDISNYRDTAALQRNIFQFKLGYFFDNDDWFLKAKAGLAIDGKKVYPLVQIAAEKRLYQHAIIAFVNWDWVFHKNSFAQFAMLNNFVSSSLNLTNTRRSDLQAGLKGTINGFSYNARFHYKYVWNMPLLVNDTNDMKRFKVIHDNASIFTIHAEAGYNWLNNLQLLFNIDYHIFKMKTEQKAWHEPALDMSLRASYNLKEKFVLGLQLFVLAQSNAKLADGSAAAIKATGDINLSAEYIFKKYLSFFLDLNNIAHQKYQRWYGYQSLGINGVVGVKFSF